MSYPFYIRNIAITSIILFFTTPVFSQKYSDKGDKFFDKNLFAEAIPFYQLELKEGNKKIGDYVMERLADCYRITGQFELAEETYKKILQKGKKNPKNNLNYGQSLKSSAKYAEAAAQFKEYVRLNPSDPMGTIYLQSCDSAQKWLDETIGKEVKNIENINSTFSEFSPVFSTPNKLVFSSSRPGTKEALISFNGGSDVHRLDLFEVDVNSLNDIKKADIINLSGINSPLHDASATFSADGKEVYFTRTASGKKDKTKNKVLSTLQVFKCVQDSLGKWSKAESAFSFNSFDYSIGQPSLSKDGKTIYFMSDMPGGFGGADIYYSKKQDDGTWGPPVNMGNEVNTFGHELFPYIAESGIFYFSSNTHPGMGQLDIFSSTFQNGKWTNVRNLKPPVNSIGNDFGIVLDQKDLRGFFSSDRFNGKGEEDIYSFSEVIPQKLTINGGLIQFPDKSIYDGIKYKLINIKSKEETVLQPKEGIYSLSLANGESFMLVAKKNGFSYNKIELAILHDTLGKTLELKIKPGLRPLFVEGYIKSGLNIDTTLTKFKDSPLENVSVILIDSTTTIEKKNTSKTGFFEFTQKLNGNENYTIAAKINVQKFTPKNTTKNPGDTDISSTNKTIPSLEVVPDKIKCLGQITFKENPLPQASVQISNDGKIVENVLSTEKGLFEFDLVIDKNYTIIASKDGFYNNTFSFKTSVTDIKTGIFKTISLDSIPRIQLKGKIKGANGVVKNVQVTIRDGSKIVGKRTASTDGTFDFPMLPEHDYVITATANGYIQKDAIISTANKGKLAFIDADIMLDTTKVDAVIKLDNIYYDYDKADVQFNSIRELDKLSDFLKANPKVEIELLAHTDSRGNPDYNLKLSQARAQNAKDYLTLEDINPRRVIPIGYGKTKPIIANPKTEEEFQINRRTEIRILKK